MTTKHILIIGLVILTLLLSGCNYNYDEIGCNVVCFENASTLDSFGNYKDGYNEELCKKHCDYGIYKIK